jgi:hypothetical protein
MHSRSARKRGQRSDAMAALFVLACRFIGPVTLGHFDFISISGRDCGSRLFRRRSPRASNSARILGNPDEFGGRRGEARTPDPGLVRAVLSQLSYPPIVGISEACTKNSIVSELIVPGIVPGGTLRKAR